jgi:hypothetical protein
MTMMESLKGAYRYLGRSLYWSMHGTLYTVSHVNDFVEAEHLLLSETPSWLRL